MVIIVIKPPAKLTCLAGKLTYECAELLSRRVFPIEYRGDDQPGSSYFTGVPQAAKRKHEAVHPPSLHIPPMSFEKRVGGPM